MVNSLGNPIGVKGLKINSLSVENAHLRELVQSGIDAKRLLAKAGLEAIESETALRLQRLMIEELHHRSKNSLAVVMALTSQTLKSAGSLLQAQVAIQHRLEHWPPPMALQRMVNRQSGI